ncbi:MAG: hypothetical protein Q4D60_04265 [Eubacteriales bacterium]|nr:hypothetical protein [Eubacteriales bacterium]
MSDRLAAACGNSGGTTGYPVLNKRLFGAGYFFGCRLDPRAPATAPQGKRKNKTKKRAGQTRTKKKAKKKSKEKPTAGQ